MSVIIVHDQFPFNESMGRDEIKITTPGPAIGLGTDPATVPGISADATYFYVLTEKFKFQTKHTLWVLKRDSFEHPKTHI